MKIIKFLKKIGSIIDNLLKKLKPIIINNSKIPMLCSTKNTDMYGITLFPFIFLIDFENSPYNIVYNKCDIVNHETIHFQQILETCIIGFYIIFFTEFIYKSIKYRNLKDGYLNISFEVEAYNNMMNTEYLQDRCRYNWIKYIF